MKKVATLQFLFKTKHFIIYINDIENIKKGLLV